MEGPSLQWPQTLGTGRHWRPIMPPAIAFKKALKIIILPWPPLAMTASVALTAVVAAAGLSFASYCSFYCYSYRSLLLYLRFHHF